MRTGSIVLLAGVALALTACGSRRDLTPVKGEAMPPAPYGATAPPSPENLMTASPQARPERSDEILTQSKERKPDPFDLPPQ